MIPGLLQMVYSIINKTRDFTVLRALSPAATRSVCGRLYSGPTCGFPHATSIVRLTVFAPLVLSGMMMFAAQGSATEHLQLEPCRLLRPGGLGTVTARCGVLEVPLNPDAPDGPMIGLKVALAEAVNPAADTTPLTLLAGGPGQAATDFYAAFAGAFARIQRHHDIFLVDQRGTGESHPLDCDAPEELGEEFTLEAVRRTTRDCLDSLDTDPTPFTTSVAVADLDRVRAALGYKRINLYGASYGTRVALHYMRRYPGHTRAVILDGVVPPEHSLGPDIALNAQRALDILFERCEKDADCRHAFPDVAGSFASLITLLKAESRSIDMQHPVTGERMKFDFGAVELALAVRLLSYAPETAALLPLLIDQAYQSSNLAPIAAQALMETESMAEALSLGMHNTIVCSEDIPFLDESTTDRTAIAGTFLGTLQLDALVEVCKLWPDGPVDDDFKRPLSSDIPVLILSGAADPITPPEYGDQVARTLTNAWHVIGPDQGHGMLRVSCVPRLMARFIDDARISDAETSCVDNADVMPFFLTFSGPRP